MLFYEKLVLSVPSFRYLKAGSYPVVTEGVRSGGRFPVNMKPLGQMYNLTFNPARIQLLRSSSSVTVSINFRRKRPKLPSIFTSGV